MTKKCGNCGAPAPDSNSRFCDLCGAPLKEEPVSPQGLPVCPACGAIVSDRKVSSAICVAHSRQNRSARSAGTRHRPHTPSSVPGACHVCTGSPGENPCRNPRCTGSSTGTRTCCSQVRKGRLPVPDDPAGEWDPWSDGDPAYDISAPLPHQQPQKPNTDLQRIAEETAQSPGAARSGSRRLPGQGKSIPTCPWSPTN